MTRTGGATPRPHRRLIAVVLASVALLTLACVSTDPDGPQSRTGDQDQTTLRVFAASSLTDVMAELSSAFEASDPGTEVELNLAGSAAIRSQILEGAPADVVATANPAVLDTLVAAGAVSSTPAIFATNRLTLAIAPTNPGRVTSLTDLADDELFLGLCATGVPCGDLADRVLASAGITARADTREPDVRSLLAKVAAGELDVGLVYATDLRSELAQSRGVDGIALPTDIDAVTHYPAAVLTGAEEPARAQAFVQFLTSPEARVILDANGFAIP